MLGTDRSIPVIQQFSSRWEVLNQQGTEANNSIADELVQS